MHMIHQPYCSVLLSLKYLLRCVNHSCDRKCVKWSLSESLAIYLGNFSTLRVVDLATKGEGPEYFSESPESHCGPFAHSVALQV